MNIMSHDERTVFESWMSKAYTKECDQNWKSAKRIYEDCKELTQLYDEPRETLRVQERIDYCDKQLGIDRFAS